MKLHHRLQPNFFILLLVGAVGPFVPMPIPSFNLFIIYLSNEKFKYDFRLLSEF